MPGDIQCKRCGATKPREMFREGEYVCKACSKIRSDEWRLANAEHVSKQRKEWRAANAEYLKENERRRYAANAVENRERANQRYADSPKMLRERRKKWAAANAESVNTTYQKRRANGTARQNMVNTELPQVQKQRLKRYLSNECRICGVIKPREKFGTRTRICRKCANAKNAEKRKAWRCENADLLRAKARQYRIDNLDARKAKDRAYYAANVDKIAVENRAYREEHAASISVRMKEWRAGKEKAIYERIKEWKAANPEKVKGQRIRRRAVTTSCEGSHTASEWRALVDRFGGHCVCCRRHFGLGRLTEDHIVPLSRGGSDFIENIQPLCQPCNSSKKHFHSTDYR